MNLVFSSALFIQFIFTFFFLFSRFLLSKFSSLRPEEKHLHEFNISIPHSPYFLIFATVRSFIDYFICHTARNMENAMNLGKVQYRSKMGAFQTKWKAESAFEKKSKTNHHTCNLRWLISFQFHGHLRHDGMGVGKARRPHGGFFFWQYPKYWKYP